MTPNILQPTDLSKHIFRNDLALNTFRFSDGEGARTVYDYKNLASSWSARCLGLRRYEHILQRCLAFNKEC
uniref:D-alanine--D-alanine ligase n=1 Tax=Loa loa TaxID=7209 RepID=A0A1I7VJ37_LOALO